jgi:tetratricopeptide (TPR) repeat protein
MVYRDMEEIDMMLEEFEKAKQGALAKNDDETISTINEVIDNHYNKIIQEEMEMVDPEELDYSYVVESCENALAANPENARAFYHLALVNNKKIEYDAAIENALKALQFETESVWISAINFELGHAYQNTVEYDKACEALQKVVDEPFLTRAEKKMGSIPGCN